MSGDIISSEPRSIPRRRMVGAAAAVVLAVAATGGYLYAEHRLHPTCAGSVQDPKLVGKFVLSPTLAQTIAEQVEPLKATDPALARSLGTHCSEFVQVSGTGESGAQDAYSLAGARATTIADNAELRTAEEVSEALTQPRQIVGIPDLSYPDPREGLAPGTIIVAVSQVG